MAGKRKRGAKERLENDSKRPKSAKGKAPTYLEPSPFVEHPVDDERRREGTLYELLGSEAQPERLQAAECIVSSLLGDEPVSEAVLQRHLEKRLFRGLASGRNASRLGFSLVITELLSRLFAEPSSSTASRYPGLTFDRVLGFLVDRTRPTGNVPGQEERDHVFGQLFGIECFVKAGILFPTVARWRKVLELLLAMGNKKVWLRPHAGWVIVQALGLMNQNEIQNTLAKVAEDGMAKTPEGVAFWLRAQSLYPRLTAAPWGHPLSKKSLDEVTLVLKESFREAGQANGTASDRQNSQSRQGASGWNPQLHFVWDLILVAYADKPHGTMVGLGQFWTRVFDDGLFAKTSTDGQKFKGFLIFQKFLEGLVDQDEKVQCLFSKHFMTCLLNQAAREDRYLHRGAVKTLKTIQSCVEKRPDVLPTVLESLLGSKGAYNFDQRTNTKTVEKLLQSVQQSTEAAVLSIISQPVQSVAKLDKAAAQSLLRSYVEYLSKLLAATASSGEEGKPPAGPLLALRELSRLAYAGADEEEAFSGVLTEQLQDLCRTRLEGSLGKLIKKGEGLDVFCEAVSVIGTFFSTQDETINAALQGAKTRMHALRRAASQDEGQQGFSRGLAMLHAVALFQLFNQDPDAVEVLKDLESFADVDVATRLGGGSQVLVEVLLSVVARPSSLMREVSRQVFASFTSQINADALDLITAPLTSGENAAGQQELFHMEEEGGDVIMDDGEEGDVTDMDEGKEGDMIDMDEVSVEFDGLEREMNSGSDSGSDHGSDSGSESGSDSGPDQGMSEQGKELDDIVGSILQSHRLDRDQDASSSESDGNMSDSAMLALDEKLAEVFKNRIKARPANSKREKKDAKQTVVNFKNRMLDLLDIFVKNESLNPLTSRVLVPLLQLMRKTSTKALGNRACEVILTYQRTMKKARNEEREEKSKGGDGQKDIGKGDNHKGIGKSGDDHKDIGKGRNKDKKKEKEKDNDPHNDMPSQRKLENLRLLRKVHEEAMKDTSHAFAKAASAASLAITTALFAEDRTWIQDVADEYSRTQVLWVLGEAKMQNSFFTDWSNWCQGQAALARR